MQTMLNLLGLVIMPDLDFQQFLRCGNLKVKLDLIEDTNLNQVTLLLKMKMEDYKNVIENPNESIKNFYLSILGRNLLKFMRY